MIKINLEFIIIEFISNSRYTHFLSLYAHLAVQIAALESFYKHRSDISPQRRQLKPKPHIKYNFLRLNWSISYSIQRENSVVEWIFFIGLLTWNGMLIEPRRQRTHLHIIEESNNIKSDNSLTSSEVFAHWLNPLTIKKIC